jgi:hypothetical protein
MRGKYFLRELGFTTHTHADMILFLSVIVALSFRRLIIFSLDEVEEGS